MESFAGCETHTSTRMPMYCRREPTLFTAVIHSLTVWAVVTCTTLSTANPGHGQVSRYLHHGPSGTQDVGLSRWAGSHSRAAPLCRAQRPVLPVTSVSEMSTLGLKRLEQLIQSPRSGPSGV